MPPGLMDRVRQACRVRHFSRRTEEAYCHWIRRFILYHDRRHPDALGACEVAAFLTSLASDHQVSASTQNQALSAVLFLYRAVLDRPLEEIPSIVRARAPQRLPVVLDRGEVRAILARLTGVPWLVVSLLYGSGLRLLEGLELRIKDIDFERHQLVVRQGKGRKDRVTTLPSSVAPRLREHLAEAERLHAADLASGYGRVVLPHALAAKYPNAAITWAWQFAFPAARICRDPRWGPPNRYQLHESAIQRAVTVAVRMAGVPKRVSCHTFRLVCDSPARGRLRHPHDPGIVGARRREHDHDLHPRGQSRGARHPKPGRSAVRTHRSDHRHALAALHNARAARQLRGWLAASRSRQRSRHQPEGSPLAPERLTSASRRPTGAITRTCWSTWPASPEQVANLLKHHRGIARASSTTSLTKRQTCGSQWPISLSSHPPLLEHSRGLT